MLPKIKQPLYTTVLPISKIEVRYRPYLMKEQKIVLIATSGDDAKDIMGAVEQIIFNCTEGTVDAKQLNAIDIGFLMAKIRAASEGGVVELNMRCQATLDDGSKCDYRTPMSVDLETMDVTGEINEEKSKIELMDGIGIKLKIPGLDMFELLSKSETEVLESLPILIDYIYDSEGIYKLENESQESIDEFIDGLNKNDITKIGEFFKSMPKLKIDVPFVCDSCGHSETIVVEDIQSFLD